MASTIRVALGVDGAKDFQNAMKQSDAAIKALGSELKLTTAEFGKNAKSEEALTAQNEVLAKSITAMKDKLAEQEKALAAVSAEFGANSAEALKFQDAVNKTKTQIAEAENQITENKDAMSEYGKETKKAGEETSTFGAVLKANLTSEAIVAAVKALANAIGDVAKKLVDVTKESAQWADDLNTLAVKTGMTTEQLQKWQYASDLVDVSVETITSSMSKLTRNMDSARDGTGATAEAFASLGVSVTDSNGALRDNEDVFAEVIDALGKIENETERDAAAMSIFGKSAQELNPLIAAGSDALKELGKEAEEAGLILGQDAIDDLNRMQDAMDGLKATAQAAGRQLTASFAQPMAGAIELVKGYLQQIVGAFQTGGLNSLGSVVGEILNDISARVTEYLPEVLGFAQNILETLITGLTQMMPNIVETAITVIQTLIDGMTDWLPKLIPVAIEAITTVVETLIDHAGDLIDGAVALITALANGLITDGLPLLIQKAPELVAHLVTAIIQNVPQLITAAVSMIGSLVTGLIQALPELGKAAWEIVQTVINGIGGLWQDILNIGSNIVQGIVQGITSAADWAWQQISAFFSGIIDGVKNFLGIHSPSTVFAGIGENMAEGIGVGFDEAMKSVSKDINNSMNQPFAANISMSRTASTVINLTTTLDGEVLARNQYKYNAREAARRGPSLVGGYA